MFRRPIFWSVGILAAIALAISSTAAAQQFDPNLAEAVLVPISVVDVPGAYGSVWSTELWYRNNSPYPVAVIPLPGADGVPSIGITERLWIWTFPPEAPGQFLLLTRPGSDRVQFDLRLFNRADPTDYWGTKLPVVRESQFGEVVNLINVDTNADARSALRIYAFPDGTFNPLPVTVRIFSDDEELLATADLVLSGAPRYEGILSLTNAFPAIHGRGRVRVQVESRGESKIWAFVSIVSNVAQRVAIVTPD